MFFSQGEQCDRPFGFLALPYLTCYDCVCFNLSEFCSNFSNFMFPFFYCANKQTSDVSGCQTKADIYLYILCCQSLDVLPWTLVQFGSLFTWGQDDLNTPAWPSVRPFISLLLSLPVTIRDTELLMSTVKTVKYNHPHTSTTITHTPTHKCRWKKVLLCVNKRLWGWRHPWHLIPSIAFLLLMV